MLVRRAQMIPLEVVIRGVAAGSFVKRRPSVARGTMLIPRIVEFFVKDDANHDPLIEPDAIVARQIATPQEIGVMSELARIVFEILAHAWRRRDTLLVDLKIEFGRIASGEGKGQLVVADVIDNDAWRRVAARPRRADARQTSLSQFAGRDGGRSGDDPLELRAGCRHRRNVSADAARHGRDHSRRPPISSIARTRFRARWAASGCPRRATSHRRRGRRGSCCN